MRDVRLRSTSHTASATSGSVLDEAALSATAVHRFGLTTTEAPRGTIWSQSQPSMHSVTACRTLRRRTLRSTTLDIALSVTGPRSGSLAAREHDQVAVEDVVADGGVLEDGAADAHRRRQDRPRGVQRVLERLQPAAVLERPRLVIDQRAIVAGAAPVAPIGADRVLVEVLVEEPRVRAEPQRAHAPLREARALQEPPELGPGAEMRHARRQRGRVVRELEQEPPTRPEYLREVPQALLGIRQELEHLDRVRGVESASELRAEPGLADVGAHEAEVRLAPERLAQMG